MEDHLLFFAIYFLVFKQSRNYRSSILSEVMMTISECVNG